MGTSEASSHLLEKDQVKELVRVALGNLDFVLSALTCAPASMLASHSTTHWTFPVCRSPGPHSSLLSAKAWPLSGAFLANSITNLCHLEGS